MTLDVAFHVLEDEVRELLEKEVVEGVGTSLLDPDEDTEILASIGAEALRRHLPVDVLADVESFRDSGRHVLRLRNLPTPTLPPTPVNGFCDEPPLAVLNALQLGLIRLMRLVAFAVPYENDGRLLRNVAPNDQYRNTASSWGADSEFYWHTDNPQLPFGRTGTDPRPYVPRFLALLGLRNEERVATDVAALDSAVARLDEATLTALQRPQFEAGAPASNDAERDGSRMTLRGTRVLERHTDGLRVRYDRDTVRGSTDEARAALEAWNDALARVPGAGSVLDAGDFLVFDNYRVLHRRAGFKPSSNPRWLRRCYAS
jgi:L-asparagine oxygenase